MFQSSTAFLCEAEKYRLFDFLLAESKEYCTFIPQVYIPEPAYDMTTTEIIKTLEKDGWYPVPGRSNKHKVFKHPDKGTLSGRPLIVSHGKKEVKTRTAASILKDAGIK